jgi:hypothetical protein
MQSTRSVVVSVGEGTYKTRNTASISIDPPGKNIFAFSWTPSLRNKKFAKKIFSTLTCGLKRFVNNVTFFGVNWHCSNNIVSVLPATVIAPPVVQFEQSSSAANNINPINPLSPSSTSPFLKPSIGVPGGLATRRPSLPGLAMMAPPRGVPLSPPSSKPGVVANKDLPEENNGLSVTTRSK